MIYMDKRVQEIANCRSGIKRLSSENCFSQAVIKLLEQEAAKQKRRGAKIAREEAKKTEDKDE